ncbi:MAG: hypothetical protein QME42_11930, partial [bacterium]|nr:hypothetical protein [bacterium]
FLHFTFYILHSTFKVNFRLHRSKDITSACVRIGVKEMDGLKVRRLMRQRIANGDIGDKFSSFRAMGEGHEGNQKEGFAIDSSCPK